MVVFVALLVAAMVLALLLLMLLPLLLLMRCCYASLGGPLSPQREERDRAGGRATLLFYERQPSFGI